MPLSSLVSESTLARAPLPGELLGDARSALWRLSAARHRPMVSQVIRFAVVGAGCTLVFSLLYLALSDPLGAVAANTLAMLIAAVMNTALNRRHTFRAAQEGTAIRHHAMGLAILALNWILTFGSLAGLRILVPAAAHLTELIVLTCANLGGTVLRFALLRLWVFPPRTRPTT